MSFHAVIAGLSLGGAQVTLPRAVLCHDVIPRHAESGRLVGPLSESDAPLALNRASWRLPQVTASAMNGQAAVRECRLRSPMAFGLHDG